MENTTARKHERQRRTFVDVYSAILFFASYNVLVHIFQKVTNSDRLEFGYFMLSGVLGAVFALIFYQLVKKHSRTAKTILTLILLIVMIGVVRIYF